MKLPALQLGVFIRDPLMKVLPFKVGETSREQTRVALNISPVAPYLGGTQVIHRRHPSGEEYPRRYQIVGWKFKFNAGRPRCGRKHGLLRRVGRARQVARAFHVGVASSRRFACELSQLRHLASRRNSERA